MPDKDNNNISNIKVLHNNLTSRYKDAFTMPYEEFKERLQDEENVKLLHKQLSEREKDFSASYDDFKTKLFENYDNEIRNDISLKLSNLDSLYAEKGWDKSFISTGDEELFDYAKNLYKRANKQLDAVTRKGNSNAFKDAITDRNFYTVGATDLVTLYSVQKIAKKRNKGEELSDAEKTLLDAFTTNEEVQRDYPLKDANMGYRVGRMVADQIPYLIQLAASGGVSSTVKKAIEKSLEKGAKKYLGRTLKKNLAKKAIAGVGESYVGAALMPNTYTDIMHRRLGNAVRDGDDIRFEGGDNTLKAIYKGWTAGALEVFTERFVGDEVLSPMMKKMTGGIKGNKTIKDITGRISGEASKKFAKGFDDFTKAIGWNGAPAEFLEEWVNIPANAMLVGDSRFEDMFDSDEQLATFLTVLVVGGAMGTAKTAGNKVATLSEKRNEKKLFKQSEKLYRDNINEDIQKEVDSALDEDVGIADKGKSLFNIFQKLTDDEQALVFNYAARKTKLQGAGLKKEDLKSSTEDISEPPKDDSKQAKNYDLIADSSQGVDGKIKMGTYKGEGVFIHDDSGEDGSVIIKLNGKKIGVPAKDVADIEEISREDFINKLSTEDKINEQANAEIEQNTVEIEGINYVVGEQIDSGEYLVQKVGEDGNAASEPILMPEDVVKPALNDKIEEEHGVLTESINGEEYQLQKNDDGSMTVLSDNLDDAHSKLNEYFKDKDWIVEAETEEVELERENMFEPVRKEQKITGLKIKPREQETIVENNVDEPLSKFKDKSGNYKYEEIQDQDVYADALLDEFGDEANKIARDYRAEKAEELEKAKKIKDPIQRKRAEKNIKQELNKWNYIVDKTDVRTPETPIEVSEDTESAKDRRNRAINAEPLSLEQTILQYFLSGGKVQRSEVKRELFPKDNNELSQRLWMLNNDADTIDQMRHIADSTPFEEEANDINGFRNVVLDIVQRYPTPTAMVDRILEIGTVDDKNAETKYYKSKQEAEFANGNSQQDADLTQDENGAIQDDVFSGKVVGDVPFSKRKTGDRRQETEDGRPKNPNPLKGLKDGSKESGAILSEMEGTEPKVGVFGKIYTQFKGKAKDAIAFLTKNKEGVAVGALNHNEIGDIDLVWGTDKYGLKKIVEKHPEMLDGMQDKISKMEIKSSSDNRIVLENNTHKAVVSKNAFGEKHNDWLLTAYEKKNTASASSIDNETEPIGNRIDTAPPKNGVYADKDTKKTDKLKRSFVDNEKSVNFTGNSNNDLSKSVSQGERRAQIEEVGGTEETRTSELRRRIAENERHARSNSEVVSQLEAEITAKIDDIQAKSSNPVRVEFVDTNGLPKHVKNAPDFSENWDAVNGYNGVVYFKKGATKSVDEAVAKWIHEVGIHSGINNILPPKEKAELMTKVYESALELAKTDNKYAEIIDHIELTYKSADTETKGEEVLAYLAEKIVNEKDLQPADRTLWEKVVSLFHDTLTKVFGRGGDLLTNQEIENIIHASVQSNFKQDEHADSKTRGSRKIRQRTQSNTTGSQADIREDIDKVQRSEQKGDIRQRRVLSTLERILEIEGDGDRRTPKPLKGLKDGSGELGDTEKSIKFVKNESDDKTETRLDNSGTVERSTLDRLVGELEKRDGAYRAIQASNRGGSESPILTVEEREELESRGINPFWNKSKFRQTLKEQAQKNGVWLDKSFWDNKTLIHDQKANNTSENDVYLNEDGKTLTKVNNLVYANNQEYTQNLAAFIDRLDAHNSLFPEVAYIIKGFTENKNGVPSMVLEQPFVEVERNATQEEIKNFLESKGFELSGTRDWSNGHKVWSNGKYELYDARPANVVVDKGGDLRFIDTYPHSVSYMSKNSIKDAESNVETKPSEKQKEAGNYRKGHVKIQGFDISIEQPKGSIRSGVDENGKEWSSKMNNTYGYFKGTKGKDGDHMDVFLGDNLESDKVFVIDQINPKTKEFDEHKVMLGFNSEQEAREAYLSNYEKNWQGLGKISETDVNTFKEWALNGRKKQKGFAEYKGIGFSKQSIEKVNERFNDDLDRFGKGELENELDLGIPSTILQNSGIRSDKLILRKKVLKEHLDRHNLSVNNIKDLPKAMQNPLMVYEWGTKAPSAIVITDLTLKDGRKVTSAIKISRNGKVSEINEIASVHGKSAERFLSDMEKAKEGGLKDALRYVRNKEKVLEWLGLVPPKGTASLTTQRLSITNIIKNFENPIVEFDKSDEVRFSKQSETEQIKEQAKANGTYMKAPNGKPTNLNEHQWLQVRTKAFKEWFGDWELSNKLKQIDELISVEVENKSLTKEQAIEVYKSLENGKNKLDNREVRFVNSSIGKILNHKGFDYKKVVPKLKEIFDNSVLIYSEQERSVQGHKSHPNFKGYHNYLGKITIDGKEHYVRLTIQEVNAKPKTIKKGFVPNEVHSAFVSDIKIYNATPTVHTEIINTATNIDESVIDTKLQDFFDKAKQSKENSSKVVDENGEPLVKVVSGFLAKSNIESATDNVGTFDSNNDDIRFSKQRVGKKMLSDAISDSLMKSAIKNLENKLSVKNNRLLDDVAEKYEFHKEVKKGLRHWSDKAREFWNERNMPIRRLEEKMLKMGAVQTDNMKAYRDLRNSFGRIEYLYKDFADNYMGKVTEVIADIVKSGVNYEFIEPYLIAKRALELNPKMRNKAFARFVKEHPKATPKERSDKIKELKNKDFSGISGFGLSDEFKTSDDLAKAIVEDFEKLAGEKALKLQESVKEASDKILDYWLQGKRITQEQYDEWKSEKHYVPLRGWRHGESKSFVYSRIDGKGSSLKTRKGRTSLPDSPLSYIHNMGFKAVGEMVDNEVKTSLLNFVMANYGKDFQKLYKIKRVYEVKSIEYDAEGNKVEVWKPTMEKPSKDLFEKGDARISVNKHHKELRSSFHSEESEVLVHTDGGDLVVVFEKDMLPVAQAFNKSYAFNFMGIDTKGLDNLAKFTGLGGMTNFMKSMFTSYSPDFILRNFLRDFPEAAITQWIRNKDNILPNLFFESIGAVKKYLNKKEDNSELGKHLRDFYENGGATGFTHEKSVEQLEKELKRSVNRAIKKGTIYDKSVNGVRVLFGFIEKCNQLAEDSVRFSVYLTAIRNGKSKRDAAFEARTASVDFNMRGHGSKSFDGAWAFFKVAINAAQKNFQLAKINPKSFVRVATTYTMLGFFEAMLNDDDEYYQINDYVRQNYLTIRAWGGYVKIPLSQYWRGFHSMGVIAYDLMVGKTNVKKATVNSVLNFIGGLSPIDIPGFWVDGKFSVAPLVPTWAKPVHEAYVTNRNFMGAPISREAFTKELEKKLADSQLHKKNVNALIKLVTDALFKAGGGDTKYKYYIDEEGVKRNVPYFLDFNPSKIEHLVKSYFGGSGKFVTDFVTTGCQIIELDVNLDNIPFLNSFVRNVPEKKWGVIREFNRLKDKYGGYDDLERDYKDYAIESGNSEKYVRTATSKGRKIQMKLDLYNKMIGGIIKAKGFDDESMIETMERAIEDVKKMEGSSKQLAISN